MSSQQTNPPADNYNNKNSNNNNNDDDGVEENDKDSSLAMLQAMGFDVQQALVALEACQGNCEQAANWLLTVTANDDDDDTTVPPAPQSSSWTNNPPPSIAEVHGSATRRNRFFLETTTTTTAAAAAARQPQPYFQRMISGTSSQYSVAQGRSACTCMALMGARNVLLRSLDQNNRAATTTTTTNNNVIITPTFLDDMIQQGVQLYQKVVTTTAVGGTSSAAEHLSAEDVLRSGCLTDVEWVGESIRQGMVTNDDTAQQPHAQGLYALLTEIIQESSSSRRSSSVSSSSSSPSYICVILTKSPETILLCLPKDHHLPTLTEISSSSLPPPPPSPLPSPKRPYYLIDTHPRPHLFASPQYAFALECASLADLVACCHQLFPVVHLGSDVSELVAIMYNSFDLYAIQ